MALYLAHPSSHRHDTGAHPEDARRLVAIEAALERIGWDGLERIEAPPASREQLLRVHDAAHIDRIESLSAAGGGHVDLDTVASADSFEAASRGAGAAALAAERMLDGEASAAFCGTRPPGHHAERDRAMGFCLFNNVAVAAAHALAACGAERVLVLDWDVHHGNGTEAIFAASDRVLFTSIHQWPLYPGTGPAEYAGEGAGEGYTVNLPVPPGAGPEEFLALVEHVVVPIGRRFAPDLIAISAGYDAHRDDPLGSCMLDAATYGDLTACMRELAGGLDSPLLVCLEGGYAPQALAESVVATLSALESSHRAPPAAPAAAEPHLTRLRQSWLR